MANPMVTMALGMAEKHLQKLSELTARAKNGESVAAELDALAKEFAGSVTLLKKAAE